MAIASLNNFTVPISGAANSGLLMPKLQYRFRVQLENFGLGGTDPAAIELTKQVVSINRPSVSFTDVDLHVYNSTVKIAGKHSWADLTLTVRDDINNNVIKKIGEQMQKQFDFMNQASARAGFDYKFSIKFTMLDGGNAQYQPQEVETWHVVGAYIKDVNYQEMNYATSDAVQVQMTIRYDNATQIEGTGLGIGGPGYRQGNQGDTASGG